MFVGPSRTVVVTVAVLTLLAPAFFAPDAQASEPFLAEIIMFGANFAPRGWAFCDGQLLSISQNTALFALLGTIYGGDGETTFALPDLRGRVPVHEGTGPGLSSRPLGQRAGSQSVVISVNQLPSHTHLASGTIMAASGNGTETGPAGHVLANDPREDQYANAAPNVAMRSNSLSLTIGFTGGNQSVPVMQPYTVVNFIIATQGTFPSQN